MFVQYVLFYLASPGRSPIRGSLTGIARKVKDVAVDWNNYDQDWSSLTSKGFKLLREISDFKM